MTSQIVIDYQRARALTFGFTLDRDTDNAELFRGLAEAIAATFTPEEAEEAKNACTCTFQPCEHSLELTHERAEGFSMKNFTIIYNPNRKGSAPDYSVHLTGCADIKLEMKTARGLLTRDAESVDIAVQEEIKEQFDGSGGDFDFDLSDYHIAPCARK